ncbi:MAG TPA: hypothetical protein DIW31_01160 [Bacteroidales bacterium]|nr:hypothetical protein [Bacteroidales bacterium]
MKRSLFIIFLLAAVAACKTTNDVVANKIIPTSVKAFLDQPFGVDESIIALQSRFDKSVKIRKMIRKNKFDAQKVDTIIRFYSRKSEVFVYKTYFKREMLLGGVIKDSKFPLVNGVTPGMKRSDFFKSFKDLSSSQKDSVELYSKELMRKFTFTFDSKGILKRISFASYVD